MRTSGFQCRSYPPYCRPIQLSTADLLEEMEKLDGQLRTISLPLQKLQYYCGYKQCFGGGTGVLPRIGGFGGGGAPADAEKTLMCLERCEAPMHISNDSARQRSVLAFLQKPLEQTVLSEWCQLDRPAQPSQQTKPSEKARRRSPAEPTQLSLATNRACSTSYLTTCKPSQTNLPKPAHAPSLPS